MVLVIDNYDSFTYNLVQYLGALGEGPLVRRNDAIRVPEIASLRPKAIVISPGPCTPREAGVSVETIATWGARIPVLGVCLGHQAIGEAYGGRVVRAAHAMHGKTSLVTHNGEGLFAALPSPLRVMRYHSLIVERASLPTCLRITAVAADDPDEVHAVEHVTHPVYGVQFHPESIMTEGGMTLIANFISLANAFHGQANAA